MSYARRVLNQVDRPLNPPDPSYNMDTQPVDPVDWNYHLPRKQPPAPVDWSRALPSGDVYYEEPYTRGEIANACWRLEKRLEQHEQARMNLYRKDSIPLHCEILESFKPKLPGRAMKFRNKLAEKFKP